MADLEWVAVPQLRRPLLIVALEGLFDAAGAATAASRHLAERGDPDAVARIDPERFFDFQQRRPEIRKDDDGVRRIHWPTNDCHAVAVPEAQHDLLVMSGVEPHLRWRSFAELVLEVARTVGAEMVVTLGAMVGLAPHTRPLGVVGSTTSPELARRLGLGRPSYQGPTGVAGILHDRLDRAELPVISLRVSVPHYVPGPPNPEATRSLLCRLELMTGIPTGHEAFDVPAREWRQRIDAAVADDADLQHYVHSLERQIDASDDLLPSGDELASQLEAFLRDHRAD